MSNFERKIKGIVDQSVNKTHLVNSLYDFYKECFDASRETEIKEEFELPKYKDFEEFIETI